MVKKNDPTSTGLKALSAGEVKRTILTFWRLDAAKAPIADFIPILDEDFEIVATDAAGKVVLRYSGLAGLEDHQYGKQIYYDQRFILKSFEAELAGQEAIAHTTGEWRCLHCEPRRACSESLRADLRHTWFVRRSAATGRPLLSRHVCTYFQYVEGYAPQPASGTDGYREFHLDFDRHWKHTPTASGTEEHVSAE